MTFSKDDLSLMLDALETQINSEALCLESWEYKCDKTLMKIYGSIRYKEIIKNQKEVLKLFKDLERKVYHKWKSPKARR